LDEQLDQRLSHQNTALLSAVKVINRRFGPGAVRWASSGITEAAP
jgi:hypothetical protein